MSKVNDIFEELQGVMIGYMELQEMIPDSSYQQTGKWCFDQLNRRFHSLMDDMEKELNAGQKAA